MTSPRAEEPLSNSPADDSDVQGRRLTAEQRKSTTVLPERERHGTAILPEREIPSEGDGTFTPPETQTGPDLDLPPPMPPAPPTTSDASSGGAAWPAEANTKPTDRLWPHFLWEFLLVIAVAITCWQIKQDHPKAFAISADNDLWLSLAVVTLCATAFAYSLRVAVPNLAIPVIAGTALLATYWLMTRHDFGWFTALATVVFIALAFGIVLGLFVVVFHVPGWIASLGAALVLVGIAASLGESFSVTRRSDVADLPAASRHGVVIFAVVAVFSVIGGAIWLFDRVRDRWSIRPVGDPASRPHKSGGLISVIALATSSALAALAGVLAGMAPAASLRLVGVSNAELVRLDDDTFAEPGRAITVGAGLENGSVLPASLATVALVAVLIGGVSVFGRRGGLFGTVLASVLLTLLALVVLTDSEDRSLYYFAGVAVFGGLVISRLVEACTKPPVANPPGLGGQIPR